MDEDENVDVSAAVEVDRIERQRQAKSSYDRKRQAAAGTVDEGRPTADVLDNFEHDALAAQKMFAQLCGFDVNGQAFGDAPTFEDINPTTISAAMKKYQSAMNPSMSISACASCGMLALDVPLDEVDLNADKVAMLRLSDEVSMCAL